MIYGRPEIHTATDVTDLVGLRTLVLALMWQPSRERLSQLDIDAEKPAPPAVSGGMLLIGSQTRRHAGVYQTLWTFEGINGDGKGTTFRDRSNSIDYGFEPGFSQVSLKLHPRWEELLKKYQGFPDENGNIIWPPKLSGGGGSEGLYGDTAEGDKNPVFGIEDFFRMEGTYRYRYLARRLPGGLYDDVGYITDSLPGEPPNVGGGRNWLKTPPIWRRRGLVLEVVETYWLSGPGGWPKPIYEKNSVDKDGALTSGILDSGRLSPEADFGADQLAVNPTSLWMFR